MLLSFIVNTDFISVNFVWCRFNMTLCPCNDYRPVIWSYCLVVRCHLANLGRVPERVLKRSKRNARWYRVRWSSIFAFFLMCLLTWDRISALGPSSVPEKSHFSSKTCKLRSMHGNDRTTFALTFFIGRPFFDEIFSRFLSSTVKKRHFFLEKQCFGGFRKKLYVNISTPNTSPSLT